MDFRALAGDMDAAVDDALGDDARIEGRPVRGMFAAPWLQPQLGRLNTAIVEPRLNLVDTALGDTTKGSEVVVAGKRYTVVSIEPDGTGRTNLILRPG
ncbi:hypothetical protein [Chitiniphilus eburneus]|uniref:head-tail joining protein n=1 Tax=Chitiniphilus eburneus TaxID=2571148 RepID=UPI0035CF2C3D